MARAKKKDGGSRQDDYDAISMYSLKKCPYCFEMLKKDADKCVKCKNKVGKINRTGFADKPVNWKGYIVSFLAWIAFACYCWWAFFDR